MEKKVLFFLTILLLVLSVWMGACAQEMDEGQETFDELSFGTEDDEPRHYESLSFYEMLKEIFVANGEKFESVLDEVYIFSKPDLKQEIAAAFYVPPVIFDDVTSVGDILCRILEVRYCGPHSECLDFLKIQYSSRFLDFEKYLSQYPDSPHRLEVTAKGLLTKIYAAWKRARRDDNEMRYREFLRIYKKCSEEYCSIFGDETETEVDCENHYLHQLNYEGYMRTPIELCAKYAEERIKECHEQKLKEEEAWASACKNNHYEDYHTYLRQYPEGEYSSEAMMQLRQYESSSWQQAVSSNTREAYENFLLQYPDGYYSIQAANNILDLFQAVHHRAKEPLFPSSLQIHSFEDISKIGVVNSCLNGHSYTLTFAGEVGRQVTLRPGETFWMELSEAANVPVLLESADGDSWIGEVHFYGGIYQLYIQDTRFEEINMFSFQDPTKLNTNTKAVAKLVREAYEKYDEELQWIFRKQ